jgi:sialic acid synthase SpsE
MTDFYDKILSQKSPYIIAEIGSNHNGDLELACQLITKAHRAGVHCVKFQSWSKETIFAKAKYEENFFLDDDYRSRNDFTLEQIVEAYSTSESELLDIKSYSDSLCIDCASTPFSVKEADFLVSKMDAPFIKIASMDLNNLPFLKYLSKLGKPLILSTGLSELHEIDNAVQTIENEGCNEIIILHCVSTYPPCDNDVNLNNILTLKSLYPKYPIGFSDHTLGVEIPLAAVSLGVSIIEKHFTLDKEMEGWDHKVSATEEEMRIIVEGSARISVAMGDHRIKAPESLKKKNEFRRSIVLARSMKAGEIINKEDIDFKRPGRGFSPEMSEFIIGHSLNKDLPYDHIILKEDII